MLTRKSPHELKPSWTNLTRLETDPRGRSGSRGSDLFLAPSWRTGILVPGELWWFGGQPSDHLTHPDLNMVYMPYSASFRKIPLPAVFITGFRGLLGENWIQQLNDRFWMQSFPKFASSQPIHYWAIKAAIWVVLLRPSPRRILIRSRQIQPTNIALKKENLLQLTSGKTAI